MQEPAPFNPEKAAAIQAAQERHARSLEYAAKDRAELVRRGLPNLTSIASDRAHPHDWAGTPGFDEPRVSDSSHFSLGGHRQTPDQTPEV